MRPERSYNQLSRAHISACMDKITVITVCYNESAERVRFTLDSIIDQNYTDMEIVVVDGGSNARTLTAFEPYQIRIKTFISEPDSGIYDAMNKGVEGATGKWIIFMNIGDSFYSADALTKMMSTENIEDADILCGDVLLNGKEYSHTPKYLSRYFLCRKTICHQAILARKTVFDSIGMFDLSYTLVSDRDWIYRALKKGVRYTNCPIPICCWEIGGKCADYGTRDEELQRYRANYFSHFERVLFASIRISELLFNRLKSLNFSIPVRLRDKLRYFEAQTNK